MYFHIAKLSKHAIAPQRATRGSACYDLFTPYSGTIAARGQAAFLTDVQVTIPEGTAGQIMSRSHLAFKHGITAFNGVIDTDFHGNLTVLLYNNSNSPYQVKSGDRIAQIMLVSVNTLEVIECCAMDEGEHKGFGSTGR